MIINKINNRIVTPSTTLFDGMKKMNESKVKMLFVFESERFIGIVTIGDIQRAIIKGLPLSSHISQIVDKHKKYAVPSDSKEDVRSKMLSLRAECMPVVNEKGELEDVVFWADLFKRPETQHRPQIHLPVIIMAGGKGTRLRPITNVIPKPLIPIGDKTILEEIMDQFESIGCTQFFMSVNYKSDMMRFYMERLDHSYDIEFFEEEKPLGTIGSVSLLKDRINTPFFVSNCDIIIDQDYRDVYEYHIDNKNDLTIVTAVKSYKIPYGVVETGEEGLMKEIKEKPEQTYMINTGVYLLNPELIGEIPENEFFHITDLMEKIQKRGGRVGCFPVSENAWKDMGEWPEYLKMIKHYDK